MAVKRDYYEVLSVERTADGDTIKKAYRRVAMQYHPDRNPGNPEAEAKFKEATEAFEVLADEERRQMYDRGGHDAVAGTARPGGGYASSVDLSDLFGDLLGSFFGGGGRRSGPQRGQSIQSILDIEMVEAATGVKKSVTIQRDDPCGTCHGTGAKPGTNPTKCRRCGGHGEVIVQQMLFQVRQPCRACNGTGSVIADPCGTCRGNRRVVGQKQFHVEIPAGVDTGDRIRYAGEGDAGDPGAPRGDLEFAVRVKEHKFFQRDGSNLLCQWPITFSQAALGGPIEITTLVGEKIKYELPRGIQTHEMLRLSGHGMPGRRGSRRGDLMVQVVVDTPQVLTPEQEQLFRRMAEMEKTQVGPPSKKSFFSKLIDLFGPDEK